MKTEPRRPRRRSQVVWSLVGLLMLGWLLLRDRPAPDASPPNPGTTAAHPVADPADTSAPTDRPPVRASAARFARLPGTGASNPAATPAWLEALLSHDSDAIELPPEAIAQWIASGRTNAADLLAARQAGGGVEYLRQALANFPNDPRVLLASIALDDGPDALRDRLNRLRTVAPENALADYLSAGDHFKNGRPDQAVADLLAASGKTRFDDYVREAMQNAEELYLQSGKSVAEAKALGSSTTLLPHLSQLKQLAGGMADLQTQYARGGDSASVENLARLGVQLGEHLRSGDGSLCLINQLVGIAIEKIVLREYPPAAGAEFLGSPTSEYLERLDAQRAEFKAVNQSFESWLRQAGEPDIIAFYDRLKLHGETAALAWLHQRNPAAIPLSP